MEFVAIDVETANADPGSICQLGVVAFEGTEVVETLDRLVDPEGPFHFGNVAVHGIRPADVRGAPRLPELYGELERMMAGRIVVSHTPFDRAALARARARYGLAEFPCTWLDSARVARRAWPKYAKRGFGLGNLAADLAIRFAHHDAAEDARAAGIVVLRAIETTGLSLAEWLVRVERPIAARKAAPPRP